MDDTLVFWGLLGLVVILVLAVLLVLASTATLGRKLADMEYQEVAGINGVRRIQAWVNVRTHGNRIGLGITAIVIGILILASVPLFWLVVIVVVLLICVFAGYAYSSIQDWLDERKQVHLLLAEQRAVRVIEDAATVKAAREHAVGEPSSLIVGHVYPAAETEHGGGQRDA